MIQPACLAAAFFLLSLSPPAHNRGGTPLAEGVWGGAHIQMTVESQGAMLELDCAHGAIAEPIVIGKDGRFRVSGTYAPEHAGPARDGEEKGRPAIYTGRLEGETLTLGISYESGEDVDTFELVRGRSGRITKCL
ncbi:MAG TPA: hypothetical protein VH394_12760 [Thermoanaerobaculia bacterium]|jgi:hypothetical protein|nr:hypothetical protein [Thermoanaerobaculia bacterium]